MPHLRRAAAVVLLALGLIAAAPAQATPAKSPSKTATKTGIKRASKGPSKSLARRADPAAVKAKAAKHTAARAAAKVATPAVSKSKPGDATLGAKIANAHESLARLEKDARRRRYRDGWESIASGLESAVKAAPASPRAVDASMLAARAREGLWAASRRSQDAASAVAAYREIERRHEGREGGQRALIAAIRFAERAGDKKDLAACGRRLASYPRGSEVREALALAGVPETAPRPVPAATAKSAPGLAGALAQVRPATAADRAARKPVDDDDSDDADAASPLKTTAPAPVAAKAAPVSAARAARAGRDAPPSPEREPDTDVPAEAAQVLDALVQAVRERGAADLLGETQAAVKAPAEPKPPDSSTPAAKVPVVATRVAREEQGDGEPEDEGEVDVVPHHTRASAPRTLAGESDFPEQEQRARALRAAALSQGATPLAAQLGLKVRTIAVDAGHGGRDTGAIGPKGLREKDATLTIARKVAARLTKLGFKVVLTRENDGYVALSERTRIANEAGADLFVSIHCNAAKRRKLSGVETWTLDVAADRYSQRLAAFENAEADATVGNLRLILADLATRSHTGEARDLAASVQSSLVRTLRGKNNKFKVTDHGVKHALFYVLLGAHMPAILVETAFLSNPEEEKRLRSAKYQDATADAVSRGLKEYLDSRRRLALAP